MGKPNENGGNISISRQAQTTQSAPVMQNIMEQKQAQVQFSYQEYEKEQQAEKQAMAQRQAQEKGKKGYLPAESVHIEAQESKAQLMRKAVTNRTLAALLSQEVSSSDSKEMSAVKQTVQKCNELLNTKIDVNIEQITRLEEAYFEAITACRYYCEHKNPHFASGIKRKNAVAGAYEMLSQEMSYISGLKERVAKGLFDAYKGKWVAADLITFTSHLEAADKKEAEDEKAPMTYQDFAKFVTKDPTDGIIYRAGKLRIVKGGILDKNTDITTNDNKELVEYLVDVSIQEIEKTQGWSDAERNEKLPALKLRLYQTLGVNAFGEKAGMLSMANYAKAIDMIGHLKSDVDYAMQSIQRLGIESTLAKVVDHALPAADKDAIKSANAVKKLRSILKKAAEDGIKLPEITDDQLAIFSRRYFYELRDQVFHRLISFGQFVKVLNYGNKIDIDKLAGDEKLMNKLMALQIVRIASASSAGAMAAEYQINSLLESAAFDYCDDLELVAAYEGTNVSLLADGGSDKLRELAMSKLATHKSWQKNAKRSLSGINSLSEVCDLLSKLQEFKKIAIYDGILESQKDIKEKYINTAAKLQKLVNDKKLMKDMAYVAGELEGTRFAAGFKELERIAKKKNVFVDSTNKLLEDADKRVAVHFDSYAFKNETKERLGIDAAADKVNLTGVADLLNKFQGPAKDAIAVLIQSKNPSELIKEAGDENAENILGLYQALHALMLGDTFADTYFNDVRLTLTVRADGDLTVKADGQNVTLPYNVEYIIYSLQRDMSKNVDKYGAEAVSGVFKETFEKSQSDNMDGDEARDLYTNIIETKTGVKTTELANFSTTNLATLAQACLREEVDKDYLQKLIQSESVKQITDVTHNELEILEIMQNLETAKKHRLMEKASVVFKEKKAEEQADEAQWKADEKQVLELLSGLFSRDDSWREDLAQLPAAAKLKKYLFDNADKLVKVIQNDELLERTLSKFQIPGAEGVLDNFKEQIQSIPMADELKQLSPKTAVKILKIAFADENEAEDLLDDELLDELVEQAIQSGEYEELNKVVQTQADISQQIAEAEKNGEGTFLLKIKLNAAYLAVTAAKKIAKTKAREAILDKRKDANIDEICAELDAQLNEQTDAIVDMVQSEISSGVSEMFGGSKVASKPLSAMSLSEIMEKNATGEEGQGKFLHLVLDGYFKNATEMDKRAMVASAIRFAKPAQTNANGAKLTNEQKQKQLGAFFGGFLKGAGPLMHKLLQGLPTTNMDPQLKQAIADTKSNLAPIPKDIVNARMEQLVRRSHKMITKIEVERSLGAASIGQAFLCRIYGPNYDKGGKEVVVKLLRPDARNHLEREKKFMLECADKTDAGMRRTYEMTLENIERELDLRIEATNVKAGQVYNDEVHKISSMKLVDVVEADTGAMMVEKAEGDTVDKYIEKQRAELNRLNKQLERGDFTDDGIAVLRKLVKLREELYARQDHVAELAKKWFIEGVYEGGFFHGDLHAGNIIVNKDRATAIDFGNATKIEKYQQTSVLHLVAAAEAQSIAGFKEHFKLLLSDASKEIYNEKEKEFEAMVAEILFKSGSADMRIAAIISEAQKMGLEIPRALQSFSNCEIRLANTLDEMNKLYEDIGEAVNTAFNKGVNEDKKKYTLDPITYIKDAVSTNVAQRKNKKKKVEPLNTLVKRELNKVEGEDKSKTYETALRGGSPLPDMGVLTNLHNMLSEKDLMLYVLHDEPIRQMKPEAWKPGVEAYLQNVTKNLINLNIPKEQIDAYLQPVKDEINKEVPDIDAVIAAVNKVHKGHLTDEYDDYMQKLEQYDSKRKEADSSEDEKEAALKEVMDAGKRLYHMSPTSPLDKAVYALISKDKDESAGIDAVLKTMLEDTELVELHPALRDTYKQIREKQKNGEDIGIGDPLLAQFKEALEAACVTRAQGMLDAHTAMNRTDPRTFYDVAGEVIGERLKETCRSKLGLTGIWRYMIAPSLGLNKKPTGTLQEKDAYARLILTNNGSDEKGAFRTLLKYIKQLGYAVDAPDEELQVKDGENLTDEQKRQQDKKLVIDNIKEVLDDGLPKKMPNRQKLLDEFAAYEQDRKGERIYIIAQELQSYFTKLVGDIIETEDDDIFQLVEYDLESLPLDDIAQRALKPEQRIGNRA